MIQTTVPHRTRRGSWPLGLVLGLAGGLLVWIAYFVQASAADWFSWEVSVVPVVGVLALVAGVAAATRPAARETWTGIAIGVVLAVPAVLGTLLFVIAFVLDLE